MLQPPVVLRYIPASLTRLPSTTLPRQRKSSPVLTKSLLAAQRLKPRVMQVKPSTVRLSTTLQKGRRRLLVAIVFLEVLPRRLSQSSLKADLESDLHTTLAGRIVLSFKHYATIKKHIERSSKSIKACTTLKTPVKYYVHHR